MDEQALLVLLQQVLAEHYGQSDCSFHSLNTRSLDDERIVYKMYRVDLRDHSSWVICAAHEDLIASHTFQWERQETACTWLVERASVLTALTAQSYPVPHVVLTRTNAAVARSGPWSVLVTTWIAGQNSQFQPEPLSLAGALLARLHTLPLEAMPLRPARWNIAYSIPHAIKALEGVRASIPASHDVFSRECLGTQLGDYCGCLVTGTRIDATDAQLEEALASVLDHLLTLGFLSTTSSSDAETMEARPLPVFSTDVMTVSNQPPLSRHARIDWEFFLTGQVVNSPLPRISLLRRANAFWKTGTLLLSMGSTHLFATVCDLFRQHMRAQQVRQREWEMLAQRLSRLGSPWSDVEADLLW